MNTLSAEQLWDKADTIREWILEGMHGHLKDSALIKEVRGRGLMIGIQPAVPTADIVRMALDRRLLLNVAGGNTIRLLPPLVMNEMQAKSVGERVADILNELGKTL